MAHGGAERTHLTPACGVKGAVVMPVVASAWGGHCAAASYPAPGHVPLFLEAEGWQLGGLRGFSAPKVGQEGGSRRSQQSPSLGAILQGLGGRSCTSSSSVSVTVTELAAATSPHLPPPSPSPKASWHHSGERERPDESHHGAVWDGGFPPALSPGAGGTVAYSCGSGSYCFSVAV